MFPQIYYLPRKLFTLKKLLLIGIVIILCDLFFFHFSCLKHATFEKPSLLISLKSELSIFLGENLQCNRCSGLC